MSFEPSANSSAGDIIKSLGTDPIPAEPYYSPAYFELEAEAIFRRSWLNVGHVCELAEPASFIVRSIEIAGASILITRGRDGAIRAFHNVCTHRGSQLVFESSGKATLFSCRYHMWTFGQDGALRSAPDFESFYVDKKDCALRPVAVDVCAGLIFVNMNPEPEQSLRQFLGSLGDLMEKLPVSRAVTFSEYVYEIEGNWKLVLDNFQENYHLAFIHARSGAPGGAGPDNPLGYPVAFGFDGPHRWQTIWTNPAVKPQPVQGFALGKQAAFAMADGLPNGPHNRDYLGMFPNLFMFGSKLQPWTHTVMPISAHRSRGYFRLYWVSEDQSASQRFAREYAMAMAREVHVEDRMAIESCHRGLSSGALKYIHFQYQEVLCRHFFNEVDRRVAAYRNATGKRDRG